MNPQPPVTDEDLLAYLQRLLGSGRVKPVLLVDTAQKAFPDVERERIVQCYNKLDSTLLKR